MERQFDWTERFPAGERVDLRDGSGELIERVRVFSRGNNFLHFLVSSDSSLVDHLKYSDEVKVASTSTLKKKSGSLSVIDHESTLHDNTSDNSKEFSKRLLKFEPKKLEPKSSNYTIEYEKLSSKFYDWVELLHLNSLPATAIPIALGIVYAIWMNWSIAPSAAILAFLGGTFLHCASNIHNELSDYHHALINNDPIERSPINQNKLSPFTVWSVALFLYATACMMGLPLIFWRGGSFLAIGTIAFLIASYYSLFRHETTNSAVLRDLSMFILMGPIMSVAASIAVSGRFDWKLVAVSIPVGIFVAVYLHEREIYNIPIDRRAGATTLAMVMGFQWSKVYYQLLVFCGYAGITVLSFVGFIPKWTLLSYLTLPLAIQNLRLLRQIDSPWNPKMSRLRYSTAILQGLFGFFYLAGFLTEVYL